MNIVENFLEPKLSESAHFFLELRTQSTILYGKKSSEVVQKKHQEHQPGGVLPPIPAGRSFQSMNYGGLYKMFQTFPKTTGKDGAEKVSHKNALPS